MEKTKTIGPTDEEIIEGLRRRDPQTTRDYFYSYCRVAYYLYDRKYSLRHKAGLDFFSIAHEYYLQLDRHDFHQLEDRTPTMSLKTWMINGFRFVLLDRLKAYQKEQRVDSFEERMERDNLRFDVADNNFSADLRKTVMDICQNVLGRDSRSSLILQMMLIDGFKGKDVAKQLGISPSAVTQRFHKLMEQVVVPYFKRYYVAPESEYKIEGQISLDISYSIRPHVRLSEICNNIPDFISEETQEDMTRDYTNRITPEHITKLKPDEIFVFGSNLAGMHGGGAARAARLYFGAILGQGEGPQGQSYAIPTMQGGVETIRPYVDKFISYAKSHPEQTFLVTPIGCGIAGFTPKEIAPLFSEAVDMKNIKLPESFWRLLSLYW